MAKYSFANNQLISGRIAATTFQRNGVEKNFVNPANTFSTYKQFQIDCITNYSELWQTLLQEEMMLWHEYSFNRSDTFANKYKFNGVQSFISINSRLAILAGRNDVVHTSIPLYDSQPLPLISELYTQINSGSYGINHLLNPDLSYAYIYSTNNLSPGIFKPRNNDFRLIGAINIPLIATDVITEFFNRFGNYPDPLYKIFTRIIPISSYSGILGSTFQTSSIVT